MGCGTLQSGDQRLMDDTRQKWMMSGDRYGVFPVVVFTVVLLLPVADWQPLDMLRVLVLDCDCS